jgi:predicted acetyltransferase
MRLHLPSVSFYEAFAAMVDDYRRTGEDRYQEYREMRREDFAAHVGWLQDMAQGIGLTPGLVPQSTFWLVQDTVIVGVSRLRHRLNAQLLIEGGHIGYDVSPSERRKGYATRLLALTLEKAGEMGLERVLVTCDSDNIASAKVIQLNGGVLEDEIVLESTGQPLQRYWIELSGA